MLLQRVLLLSTIFTFGFSYNLYSTIDQWTGMKYDCIYVYLKPTFFEYFIRKPPHPDIIYQPKEETMPFCLTVEHFTVNEEPCTTNGGIIWTFDQLKKQNITSNDLVNWNATVNTIDEYEAHLQTDNNELVKSRFCNCSDKFHFGRECQYSFGMTNEPFYTILESHFFNLGMIFDDEIGMMNDADVTCYKRDASCFGSCLDWRQICNGIVDCSDGQDEVSCDLLEFNECRNDEYRCRSGHCIPMIFAFDTILDCADGSDEDIDVITTRQLEECYRKIPNMFCDDFNSGWMMFPCGDGLSTQNPFYRCENRKESHTLKQLYAGDITVCWQYLVCTQHLDYLFPLLVNCSALCGEHCSNMVLSMCQERIVFFPPRPIMYSPAVYLAYQTNKTEHSSPDFICYTQCDHLYSPTSKHHGYSCRSIADFDDELFDLSLLLHNMIADILHLFGGCINNTQTNNSSLIFYCPIGGKAISYHRIKDGFQDCYFALDESITGASTCIQNSTQRFRCWTGSDECILRRFIQDFIVHCSDQSDEFYNMRCYNGKDAICDYKRGLQQLTRIQYEFKDLCDGREYLPSLFWLINGTDETDCEDFWCLSSPSTRCNGYWDCIDGRDELNCSLHVLPTDAKSTKLLHTLNGCDAMEHFCLHVSNGSRDLSRSCIPASYAGDGYVDCWGATDERHNICQDGKTTTTVSLRNVYHCLGEDKICVKVNEICNGRQDCPIGDDEELCNWAPKNISFFEFFCSNGTRLHRALVQCDGKLDCASGEDEWFCDLEINAPRLINVRDMNIPFYPPSLQNNTTRSVHQIQTRILAPSSTKSSWYCNRGISIADTELRRCLCPENYSGERCEYQRERISVILQIISPPSLQRHIAIKFVLYLIDVTSLSILVEEEILHLPYVHSSYKHLVTLSSVRANNSFVRIDAYEVSAQQVIAYRTSWKFDLLFPFLPVRRLATGLDLTDDGGFVYRSRLTCHTCLHGQCLFYRNSDDVFCHCYNGWAGPSCNESFLCAPAAMSLNSRRCLCPMNRHGIRCFAPNRAVCQCQNGATCIPLNARTEQSACLCSDNYFGQYCERQHASLTIKTFGEHQPQTLPIVLFQFVDLTDFDTTNFQNTFLLEHVSTHRPLVIYHANFEKLSYMVLSKVFYSSSIDDYRYYIVLYMNPNVFTNGIGPKHVQTQLEASQQCLHVRQMEVFKTPINILAYPYIKRIKFYLRRCSDNKTRCFHDEIYLCLCPIQNDQAANCIIYDHTREVCQKSSYCLNEGLCIENRRNGIVQFACLCPSCHYYGALCQFSLGKHGLSLDALVGIEMRTGKTLSEQSILIKLSMTILISMITFGFIGNILCIITFARKKSREAGCGYYLFVISVCNQLALIMLGLRFVYLLVTQMVVWNNRVRSLILCQCLEYGLTILPNLSNWLSACVSVERTFTVARGALFDQQTSIRIAKRLCIVLLIVLAGMTVHESINRQLIQDPRLGRYTWCVAKFNSAQWRTLSSTLSFVHLLGPFLINFLSTGILIVIITRQKLTVQQDKTNQSFYTALRKQVAHYKHLIISPTVLLVLALPRLIISLGSLCIDTSWRNYVFLAGYFISFMPFMATLFIFVIPAPLYQDELKVCLSSIRRLFIANRCSH